MRQSDNGMGSTAHMNTTCDRLVGLVFKVFASKAEDPGSIPACGGFSGSSHTKTLKTGTPVATRYRVSAETDWPGVSILWLSEVECLTRNSISMWQDVNLSEQIVVPEIH